MEFVLTRNNFYFNGDHYLQIRGTRMGTKMEPSYAKKCMTPLEKDVIYTYHTQPLMWKRYLDDCFGIWVGSLDSLQMFIDYFNACNPNIHLTMISHRSLRSLSLTNN